MANWVDNYKHAQIQKQKRNYTYLNAEKNIVRSKMAIVQRLLPRHIAVRMKLSRIVIKNQN